MNRGVPPEDWDTKLQQVNGSFLQSRPWAQFQQTQGYETFWDQGDGWQWLARLRVSHGLRYLLCSYGPAGEGSVQSAIPDLAAIGRKLGADFIRLEPQTGITAEELRRLGAQPIAEVDPQYTRVVDLDPDEAALRSALSSGHRNRINGTERRGIVVRQTSDPADFQHFLAMLHDTAARSKVTFWPDSYFHQLHGTLAPLGIITMYIAEAESQPVAAAMFYDWGGTRYYAHAGAFQERNRKLKANVSLVWQALLDAKAAGLQHFDLFGVAPEGDSGHHLASISEFKAGFGGRQVDYLGTWDLPLKKGKYRAYGLYRKLRGRR